MLDLFRVQGASYIGKNMKAPWGMQVDAREGLYRFHLVLSGSSWIEVPDTGGQARLSCGDFVIIPHGKSHVLKNRPDTPVMSQHAIPDVAVGPVFEPLEDNGTDAHLLCGYFRIAEGTPPVIVSHLPDILLLSSGKPDLKRKIRLVVDLIRLELQQNSPPSQTVLNRLTEILCHLSVNRWFKAEQAEGGVLRFLVDPKLQAVLDAVHADPGAEWTVESLARHAGQSRTVFSGRFRLATGLTPMGYVLKWRHEVARRLLTESDLVLDEVAIQVGYGDTNAFNRAFRREIGVTPGAFRRAARG